MYALVYVCVRTCVRVYMCTCARAYVRMGIGVCEYTCVYSTFEASGRA